MADTTFLHNLDTKLVKIASDAQALTDESKALDAEVKAEIIRLEAVNTGGGDTGTLTLMPADAKPGDLVTITGSGFGATGAVSAGNYPNTVVSWADDLIVSRLHPDIPPGIYNVYINSVWLGLSITALAADGTGGDTGGGDGGGDGTSDGTGDTGGDGTGGGDTGGGDDTGGDTGTGGSEGGVGYVSGGNGQPIVVSYIAPQRADVGSERPVFKTVVGMSLQMTQPVMTRKSEVVFTWNNPDAHDPPHAFFGDSVSDDAAVIQAKPVPFAAVALGLKNVEVWLHGKMKARFTPDASGNVAGTVDLTGEKNGPLVFDVYGWNSPPGGSSTDGTFRQCKQRVVLFVEGGVDYVKPPLPAAVQGMRLLFEDNFDGPLSISHTDKTAKWFDSKPEPFGEGQFGEAIFARAGSSNFYQRGSFLRLRCQYEPGVVDPFGWNRVFTGATISTGRPGGDGGFYQKIPYYFDSRFLWPTGSVSWPAQWQLTLEGLLNQNAGNVETDTMEGVGPFPANYRAGGILYHKNGTVEFNSDPRAQPATYYADRTLFEFHTYGCLVKADVTEMFLDGVSLGTYPTRYLDGIPTRSDFFMLDMDLEPGFARQWLCTLPGTDHFDMWVDYVRVWGL